MCSDGFTQMPNEFLDNSSHLSDMAFRLLSLIYRKTIGHHKDFDQISNGQLMKLSGIKNRIYLNKAIQELIKDNRFEMSRMGVGKGIKTIYRLLPNGCKTYPIEMNKQKFNTYETYPLNLPNGCKTYPIDAPNGCKTYPTKESNKINKIKDTLSSKDIEREFFENIKDSYIKILGNSLPKINELNPQRISLLKARSEKLKTIQDWEKFFNKVLESDWLCGRTDKGEWRASFDWIINKSNFMKINDDNYNKFKKNKPSACELDGSW